MFKYKIRNIKIFGYHGIYDDEIKNGQDFFISISYELKYDNSNLNIDGIVDYSSIINHTKSIFISRRYNLMENLTKDIYDYIMKKYDLKELIVEIKKKNPKVKCQVQYISTIYNG